MDPGIERVILLRDVHTQRLVRAKDAISIENKNLEQVFVLNLSDTF